MPNRYVVHVVDGLIANFMSSQVPRVPWGRCVFIYGVVRFCYMWCCDLLEIQDNMHLFVGIPLIVSNSKITCILFVLVRGGPKHSNFNKKDCFAWPIGVECVGYLAACGNLWRPAAGE